MKTSLLFIKVKNIFIYITHLGIFQKLKKIQIEYKPNTLLLIRLDAIGDYILFRNFLEVIKKSKRFENYKITLCGNIIWKDLSETFDSNFVDEFIWLNRKNFYGNLKYKFNLLKKIKESGFEIAVDMAYSREILYGDSIIRASQAKIRIGSEGAKDKHVVWKRNLFSNKYYTDIIPVDNNDTFEFNRNKEYLREILNEEINLNKPFINTSVIPASPEIKNKYVVLFPGTSEKNRMWAAQHYRVVAEFIIKEYSYTIVVSGSLQEKELADNVKPKNAGEKFINLSGNTLTELAKLISGAELLISNDTSAVHFAAAVDTPFICIVNGRFKGRFYPYPEDVYKNAFYVYPNEFTPGRISNINTIPPEMVNTLIKNILN